MKITICILLLVSLLLPVAGMASGDQTDEMFFGVQLPVVWRKRELSRMVA